MQRERSGGRNKMFETDDPFNIFQSFGTHRNPFDDPFFSRPLGSMFDSSPFDSTIHSGNEHKTDHREKGVVIEELNSDDDEGGEKKEALSSQESIVEHPEDDSDAERKIRNICLRNEKNKVEDTKSQARVSSVHTCKVTYGGVDGTYYTSSRTRRAGGDGVVVEESKEADKTTGQATHRISRGIHDKGHSVTRKLNPDGKVDMMQTLHNLNEDELSRFEDAWKGNAKSHFIDSNDSFHMHEVSGTNNRGWQKGKASMVQPLLQLARNTGRRADTEAKVNPSESRSKRIVRINIE